MVLGVSSLLLPHLFCVDLRLFLHAVCFETRRLDQLVEALLLDLDVCFGLGHRCRRDAGPSESLGSAGGSLELPSVLLPVCDQAAVPLDGPLARARVNSCVLPVAFLAVEEAGHAASSDVGAGKGKCVKRACA